MKRFLSVVSMIALFALASLATAAAAPVDEPETAAPAMNEVRWMAMSKNLVRTLKADNEGAKIDAMRLIIQHGAFLHVRDARVALMDIYRSHDDAVVRGMAVASLGVVGDYWSIGYLRRAMEHESSPALWTTMRDVVAKYDAR